MNYLLQSETLKENTLAYEYTESEDAFIKSLSEPELESLPCHDIHDGIQLLRNKHDQGLDNDLSFVLDNSAKDYLEKFVRVSTLMPFVQNTITYDRLSELCKEHGRIKCNTSTYITDPSSEGGLRIYGLYSTGWGDDNIFEYSPSKIKRRANQGKYQKRGRMRNGDVPIDVFRHLTDTMENWLIEMQLPHYQSGSGSSHGACSNFVTLYNAMVRTDLLPQMRSYYSSPRHGFHNWVDHIETASHYVNGCKEKNTTVYFAEAVESECAALEKPTLVLL